MRRHYLRPDSIEVDFVQGHPVPVVITRELCLVAALQAYCSTSVLLDRRAYEIEQLLSDFGILQWTGNSSEETFDRLISILLRLGENQVRHIHWEAQDESVRVKWKRGQFLREVYGLSISRRRDQTTGKYLYTIKGDPSMLIPHPSEKECQESPDQGDE